MSMPALPVIDPPVGREDALNLILASIAMEELGLSHILNAEGEKIQFAVGTLDTERALAGGVTMADLIALDQSVVDTLEAVTGTQTVLLQKMQAALAADVDPGPEAEV